MVINICDVPDRFVNDLKELGGSIIRYYGGLNDVAFETSDIMRFIVRDEYIKIRNRDVRKSVVLANDEFTFIHIH